MSKIHEMITSPNQSGRSGHVPQLIVCHIADGTYEGTKAWFGQTASQTSSHFVVGQDGRICQCVPLDKMAWCNGTSTANTSNVYYGYAMVPLVKQLGGNVNWYSVSIEHEGYYSKTKGALTEAQLQATVWLIGYIREQVKLLYGHEIPLDRQHIVGHYEINPKTKPCCPGEAFQWDALLARLSGTASGGEEATTPEDKDDTAKEVAKDSIVRFTGGKVYASSTAAIAAGTRSASSCRETVVAPGAAHPYHLVSVDDGTVYGWVDAASTEVAQGGIAVGALVKVTGNSYATGQSIPAWVKAGAHTVSQISGDKALLGAGSGINSWVYLKDLQAA